MVTTLRPYQQDVFNAVTDSAAWRIGLTFSVEISRRWASERGYITRVGRAIFLSGDQSARVVGHTRMSSDSCGS